MNSELRKGYTVQDLASREKLWNEYVDADNVAPFHSLSIQERMEMIRQIWPETPESPEDKEDDENRKFWNEVIGF